MVSRTVDDDIVHAVVVIVVEVGFRVKIAVGGVKGQLLHHPIGKGGVEAIGAGIIHILIHTRLYLITTIAEIGGGNARRNLTFRHIHQRYHAVQPVEVARDGGREPTAPVFDIG